MAAAESQTVPSPNAAQVIGRKEPISPGMHVAHLDARPFHLDRADKNHTRAHRVDIHMSVGFVLRQLLGGQAVCMDAPTRNDPKSPPLWLSRFAIDGQVPSCSMKGRIRTKVPGTSEGAKFGSECWRLVSGRAE